MKKIFLSIVAISLLWSAPAAGGGEPPVFTGCPEHVSGSHCDSLYFQVVAVDPSSHGHGRNIRYHLISGPGEINEMTGLWVFHPTTDDISRRQIAVEIAASLGDTMTTGDENCRFPVGIRDQYLRFTAGCEQTYHVVAPGTVTVQILAVDEDPCDIVLFRIVDVFPRPYGSITIDEQTGLVTFSADSLDADRKFTVAVAAGPEHQSSFCVIYFQTGENLPEDSIALRIESNDGVVQGLETVVDIIVEDGNVPFASYDLEVAYDAAALNFIYAEGGPAFYDGGCRWEYFTYRYGPDASCSTNCPTGLLSIRGRAEASKEPLHPVCYMPDSLPAAMASLHFLVSNDRTLAGQYVPIRFLWLDCRDNRLAFLRGESYMSQQVVDHDGTILPPTDTLPTYSGAPPACSYETPAERIVTFYNGGLHIQAGDTTAPIAVCIETERGENGKGAYQGQFAEVDILLDTSMHELGGFNLLVGYDVAALALYEVFEGDLHSECDWEYFTHRLGPFPPCTTGCPSGLVRVVGVAEINNGPYHPTCFLPDSMPASLATIKFLVSNDRTLECQFVPIRFFWTECGDNALSNRLGDKLFVSTNVYDFDSTILTRDTVFPTFGGIVPECFEYSYGLISLVDFFNGGVQIICADSIDHRGDINLNGVAYEVADAVMFINYFVIGLSAFGDHVEASTTASDINADGVPLTIEDLVYLIRVLVGDAQPYPQVEPSPNIARFYVHPATKVVSVETPDSLGAVVFSFYGDIAPTLLQPGMDMKYRYDGERTRVLIYSLEQGKSVRAGELIRYTGDGVVQGVCAATYEGCKVNTVIRQKTDLTKVSIEVERGLENKGVIPGQFTDVDISLESVDAYPGMGGFNFLFGYDASALNFYEAIPEPVLFDDTLCGWEYFTYRYGPDGNCGVACPTGIVRVIGMAETNDGPHHPDPACKDYSGRLFSLNFLVSDDRTLQCQFVPIRFFWTECGDNVISNWDASELYISSNVFDYDSLVPIDETVGVEFPTYLGAQEECEVGGRYDPIRNIDFYNGGVQIICAEPINSRGDVNVNGVAYEIADAVTFARYFVHGLSSFGDHVEASIAASDVNKDGVPLTIEDFVYLTRIVVGDAVPLPLDPSPNLARFHVHPATKVVSVETPDSLGAVHFIFRGQVGAARLPNNDLNMIYIFDGEFTRLLIYSIDVGNPVTAGPVVSYSGDPILEEVYTATYEGERVNAVIDYVTGHEHSDALPEEFALSQNYPNPFNPATTIEYGLPCAGDVEIVVYNIAGQRVRTLVDRDMPAGYHSTTWYGTDDAGRPVASGIYLYKLTAGDFIQSRKMLFVK